MNNPIDQILEEQWVQEFRKDAEKYGYTSRALRENYSLMLLSAADALKLLAKKPPREVNEELRQAQVTLTATILKIREAME